MKVSEIKISEFYSTCCEMDREILTAVYALAMWEIGELNTRAYGIRTLDIYYSFIEEHKFNILRNQTNNLQFILFHSVTLNHLTGAIAASME